MPSWEKSQHSAYARTHTYIKRFALMSRQQLQLIPLIFSGITIRPVNNKNDNDPYYNAQIFIIKRIYKA